MTRDEHIAVSGVDVRVTTGRILDLFERAPHKTFFHVRDTLGAIFGSHRREWLAKTEVRFQRGGLRAAAFGGRDSGGGFRSDKQFFYRVLPKKKSVPRSETPRLENISAEAYTRSRAALSLERGGTFRAKGARHMAIPIGYALNKNGNPKPGFSSPEALQRHPRLKNKGTTVFAKPGEAPIIYLKKKLRRRTRLLPIFLLVRSITRRPRLRFMSTWADLSGDRDRRMARAADKIVEELSRGR